MKNTALLQAAILHDQTHLVDSILKEKSEAEHFCQWYNHLAFTISLAEEQFSGNLEELEQAIQERKNQLKSMLQQVKEDETLADTTLYNMAMQRLKDDIQLLETVEGSKEQVFQWLLVPYWLSELLILKAEIVLRICGSSWWGITSPLQNTQELVCRILEDV